jgi:hypothetical protein
MGAHSHTAADKAPDAAWADEVIDCYKRAWNAMPSLKGRPIEQAIQFAPISYDPVFFSLTNAWNRDLGELEKALGNEVWAEVEKFQPENDAFFWDNIVDVLLYRFSSQIFRAVRVRVLDDMIEVIREHLDAQGNTQTKFSVMSHSLGTAVTNEALHYLATRDIDGRDVMRPEKFTFHRYFALANVSGVLWREERSIYDVTALRPPLAEAKGAVREMINFQHAADPFPAPCCFEPTWQAPGYRHVRIEHVQDANVHGWTHYLAHPDVMGTVLRSLFPTTVKDSDIAALTGTFKPYEPEAAEAALRTLVRNAEARYRVNFADPKRVIGPFVKTVFQLTGEVIKVGGDLLKAMT